MERETYPLTQTQLGMYLDWNVDRSSRQYVICVANRFPAGKVDPQRLASAVQAVFRTCPVLRTHLVEQDGEIRWFADDAYRLDVDIREIAETDIENEKAVFERPYCSSDEPFMRATVLVSPQCVRLLVSFFHLVMDGTSERLFTRALSAAYEGRPIPSESFTFADYATLEPALFDQPDYAAAREDHLQRFGGKSMSIPEDPEAARSTTEKGLLIGRSVRIPRASVEDFCRAEGVHPNLFFMGAFARTLALYTNRRDVVFFTANHGRKDPRLSETMGAFVKTAPCLAEMKGELSLKDYLLSLKLHRVGVYPFTHFCNDLGMTPGLGFIFQDGTIDLSLSLDGVVAASEHFSPVGVGAKPALEIYGDAESFRCHLSCLSGEYTDAWIASFVERYAEVVRQFLAHPESRLGEIPVVSDVEADELLKLGSGGVLEYDETKTIVDVFDAHAAAEPDRTALVDCDGSLTYSEVKARSVALAEQLVSDGVKAGGFVGVMLPRRNSFMVATLAIQRCGCGYVPLDADYPTDRLAYMLENSEAAVLVTTHELYDSKGISFAGRVVFVEKGERVNGEKVKGRQEPFPPFTPSPFNPSPASPAYMIYTSGSTGKPKGVVISQRALVAMCAWVMKDVGLDATSRVGVAASFSFDASVIDLFPAVYAGAELHVFSEALRKDIAGMYEYARTKQMTGWTMSTQLGLATLNAYPDIPLRYMILGGEKLVPYAKSAVRVYNGYGPTEFTVCSSAQLVDQSKEGEIPIGRPVPNSDNYVVDVLGQLVPRGFVGELCLAGVQIADGYWRLPEKTAISFVRLAFVDETGYRTGDFVKWNAEGLLEYRGRIDAQVKLRGFRIEIGEIEHAAAACAGVTAVAAEVREIAGTQHLVLYYCGAAEADAVKAKMSETLTGYMVPDYFVCVPEMPLKPGGKIDRKALPTPSLTDEPVVPPANALEEKILSVVKAVLKPDAFGVTHDFNRLGLTSLGAMSLVARLKKECGIAVTLSALAKSPSVRQLAARAGRPAVAPDRAMVGPAVPGRPRRATYPMTENQRGIYVDWLRNPGTTQYNVPVGLRFPNHSAEDLAAAVSKVIDAHPAFKTRFIEKDGEIVQSRRDDAKIEVAVEKLSAAPDVSHFAKCVRPFAPANADLVRATVFAAPDGAYLFLDAHHTVFDGASMGVVLSEIVRVLDGEAPKGECASVFDAALDERDYLESDLVAEDDEWFAKYLDACESTRLDLPAPAEPAAPGTAARVAVKTPAKALVARTGELGVSASDWMLTALMELLRRVGRTDDVQITFVSAGRSDADLADTVGMFVKTLPIRNVRDKATFSETVRATHERILEILDRDRVSYARLAERQGLSPEIIFAFEGGLFDLPHGVEILAPQTGTAKFPLSVTVTPGKDDFELAFEYDASLYAERDMRQLLAMYETLVQGAVGEDTLRALPLVSSKEAEGLIALSAGSALDYDASKTFVDLFREQAAARPEATAVVDCETSISYGALDGASDALAAKLVETGVAAGGFVGVMLPRRVSFITSVLAVQKCGCGYVPLDADYPADRLAYMLENSKAAVLVTTHELFDCKDIPFAGRVVFVEKGERVNGEKGKGGQGPFHPFTPSPFHLSPVSPAYMIYTSGSTGKPKGVVVAHRALAHLIAWDALDRKITRGSRVMEHASFSFDASVIDIFPTLAAGGELHLLSETLRKDLVGMRDYIVEKRITAATMPTQIGMALVDAYPELPLDNVMFGGEKLLPTAPTKIRLINGYGPTEFCVCSSFHNVDQAEAGDIPIGRAVPGTWSFVVDRYGHLLPQGFPGEIALAGPQLAEGYWRLPEKTASVFAAMPFCLGQRSKVKGQTKESLTPLSDLGPLTSDLCYRTGDLARYDDLGRLQYLGRIDFQVKLRGFRIEIGEIEHVASRFAGVKAVAAEVRDVGGTKHLVLYYSAEGVVDEAALKASMAESLAEYMVPDYFVRLDELPVTPGGKINRKQLPAPAAAESAAVYVEPANDTERTIAETYGKILRRERYGATDDFFACGGTSIVAIKAVVALQKAGLDVQYGDLFKYKTPQSLAAFLSGASQPAPFTSSPLHPFTSYDYSSIDALLARTRTDLFTDFRRHSLGDVLLTGATGYLGIHILRRLLETTDSTVYALVRAKGGRTARRRLDADCVYYFGERLPKRFEERLVLVEGDVTNKDLGTKLGDAVVGTVINCAALVKHYIADDAMDRINVGGTENLIAFCAATKARLVHTSTYSVGGTIRADSAVGLDERHLYVGQESDNDYVRTKFLAERAVLEATAAGKIRGKVMRLGNLMGRESDGEFQMNVGANAFVNSLKSYKAIGAYPLEEMCRPLEMSPIDRVAEAIVLLASTPDDLCVFHPYNRYALDMGAVLGAMNRRGYDVDVVSRADFAKYVDALRNDPARVGELQGILHYAGHLLSDRKMTPVVNDWTTTVLYRLGFRWRPADDLYLANFFNMLEGLAVFD